MSNLWINVRFGVWHFQITSPYGWWNELRSRRSPIRLMHNPHHAKGGWGREGPDWRWFDPYQGGLDLLSIVVLAAGIIAAIELR